MGELDGKEFEMGAVQISHIDCNSVEVFNVRAQ